MAQNGKLILSVTGLDKTNISDFLTKTMVQLEPVGKAYQPVATLKAALEAGDAANAVLLQAVISKGSLGVAFNLNAWLKLNGFDKFKITPYLGDKIGTKTCELVIAQPPADLISLGYQYGQVNGPCPAAVLAQKGKLLLTVTGLSKTNINDFLTKTMVQLKPVGKDYQAPISLNDQILKGPPKNKTDLQAVVANGVLGDAFDLNALLSLDGFQELKITPYLGDKVAATACELVIAQPVVAEKKPDGGGAAKPDSLYTYIPTPEMDADWAKANPRPDRPLLNGHTSYALEYDFGRYDPVKVWKRLRSKVPNTEYYSATDSKPLRPKAYRDLLLSVRNFQPYRDSLSVTVDFLDRDLEHAGAFTSAYNNGLGSNAAAAPPATPPGDDKKTAAAAEDNDLTPEFKELGKELAFYYQQKRSAGVIDISVLDNGVMYIKSRMTEAFKIADFSEAGIIKAAEDAQTAAGGTVTADFTAAVRTAAANFLKVSRYNYFDNRDIFIQNRDAVQLTLNFFRDGKAVPNLTETRPYNISNGFKVDFSLGLYGSFLKDNLYTTRPVRDTGFFTLPNGKVNRDSIVSISATATKAKIIRDNQGAFSAGPAVYSHLYWKTGSEFNAGLTFGISIDQTATPRYLAGGSLLFGVGSRWVLTYGAAFGKVKNLASGLSEGQVVDLTAYPNSTLPTKDMWDVKGFVGISWNFTGFNIGGDGKAKAPTP